MRFCAASTALAVLLAVIPTVPAELSKTGNITLFSDTSCTEPVYVNSWTLGRDVCGVADDSASSTTDIGFQSYILNERPWCTNGSRPYFNVYSDEACSSLIHSYKPGALYNPEGPDADGTCVAPGDYKAMAFICDGFPGAWGEEGSTTPSSSLGGESTKSSITDSSTYTTSNAASPTASATSNTPVTTTSSAPNGTALNSNSPTSLPTSAFDGAGSLAQVYHNPVVALVLPVLGLLA